MRSVEISTDAATLVAAERLIADWLAALAVALSFVNLRPAAVRPDHASSGAPGSDEERPVFGKRWA